MTHMQTHRPKPSAGRDGFCAGIVHTSAAGFRVSVRSSGSIAPATNSLPLTFETVCQDSGNVSEQLQGFECKHVKTVQRSVSGVHLTSECQM